MSFSASAKESDTKQCTCQNTDLNALVPGQSARAFGAPIHLRAETLMCMTDHELTDIEINV